MIWYKCDECHVLLSNINRLIVHRDTHRQDDKDIENTTEQQPLHSEKDSVKVTWTLEEIPQLLTSYNFTPQLQLTPIDAVDTEFQVDIKSPVAILPLVDDPIPTTAPSHIDVVEGNAENSIEPSKTYKSETGQCQYCNIVMTTRSLRHHVTLRCPKNPASLILRPLRCPIIGCSDAVLSADDIWAHFVKYHRDQAVFKCNNCSQAFQTSLTYRWHRDHVKCPSRSACELGQITEEVIIRRRHSRPPEKIIMAFCNFCKLRILKTRLDRHQLSCLQKNPDDETRLRCIFTSCPTIFSGDSNIPAHVESFHSSVDAEIKFKLQTRVEGILEAFTSKKSNRNLFSANTNDIKPRSVKKSRPPQKTKLFSNKQTVLTIAKKATLLALRKKGKRQYHQVQCPICRRVMTSRNLARHRRMYCNNQRTSHVKPERGNVQPETPKHINMDDALISTAVPVPRFGPLGSSKKTAGKMDTKSKIKMSFLSRCRHCGIQTSTSNLVGHIAVCTMKMDQRNPITNRGDQSFSEERKDDFDLTKVKVEHDENGFAEEPEGFGSLDMTKVEKFQHSNTTSTRKKAQQCILNKMKSIWKPNYARGQSVTWKRTMIKCSSCGKLIQNGSMKRHLRDSCGRSEAKTILCPAPNCLQVKRSRIGHEIHQRLNHDGRRVTLTCDFCQRTLSSSRNLHRHFQRRSACRQQLLRKNNIETSPPRTPQTEGMDGARVRKSPTTQPGMYQCTYSGCTTRLRTLIGLRVHIKNVHEGGLPSCDHCDNSYSSFANLGRHYGDSECGRLVVRDMKSSTGVVRQSEPVQATPTLSNLSPTASIVDTNTDRETSKKVKPFLKCPIPTCRRTRVTSELQLGVHMRIYHHSSGSLVCDYCQLCFQAYAGLRHHLDQRSVCGVKLRDDLKSEMGSDVTDNVGGPSQLDRTEAEEPIQRKVEGFEEGFDLAKVKVETEDDLVDMSSFQMNNVEKVENTMTPAELPKPRGAKSVWKPNYFNDPRAAPDRAMTKYPSCKKIIQNGNKARHHRRSCRVESSVNRSKDLVCPDSGCSNVSKTLLAYQLHTRLKHHDGLLAPSLKCDYCQNQFSNTFTLRRHFYRRASCRQQLMLRKMTVTLKNIEAAKERERPSPSSAAHVSSAFKISNDFECTHPDCTVKVKSLLALKVHIQVVHGVQGLPLSCDYCHSTYSCPGNLRRHYGRVERCGRQGLADMKSLTATVKADTVPNPKPMLADTITMEAERTKLGPVKNVVHCPNCKTWVSSQLALRIHTHIFHCGKRSSCDYCQKHCKNSSALRRHFNAQPLCRAKLRNELQSGILEEGQDQDDMDIEPEPADGDDPSLEDGHEDDTEGSSLITTNTAPVAIPKDALISSTSAGIGVRCPIHKCPTSRLSSQLALRIHMHIFHRIAKFGCDYCNLECGSRTALRRHFDRRLACREQLTTDLESESLTEVEVNLGMTRFPQESSSAPCPPRSAAVAAAGKNTAAVAPGDDIATQEDMESVVVNKPKPLIKCPVPKCSSTRVPNELSLRVHMRVYHRGGKPFCDYCQTGCKSSFHLRRHFDRRPACWDQLKKEMELDIVNKKKIETGVSETARNLDQPTKTKGMKKHKKGKDKEQVTCHGCGVVMLRGNLLRHVLLSCKNKLAKKKFSELKCGRGCDDVFVNKAALDEHLQEYHTKKMDFECGSCGKQFVGLTVASIKFHDKYCGVKGVAVGPVNSDNGTRAATAAAKISLGDSTTVADSEPVPKKPRLSTVMMARKVQVTVFECVSCGRRFASESGLHQHAMRYCFRRNIQNPQEHVREWNCVFCMEIFDSPTALALHIRNSCQAELPPQNPTVTVEVEDVDPLGMEALHNGIQSQSESPPGNMNCGYCHTQFLTREALMEHFRTPCVAEGGKVHRDEIVSSSAATQGNVRTDAVVIKTEEDWVIEEVRGADDLDPESVDPLDITQNEDSCKA